MEGPQVNKRIPRVCTGCAIRRDCESVTVRVYRARKQLDFRYTLCLHCREILESFLEANASSVKKGLFPLELG